MINKIKKVVVKKNIFLLLVGLFANSFSGVAFPEEHSRSESKSIHRLKTMSLEQLANIEVSIAAKKPQAVEDVSAAVFVITRDDIRRSTVNSIPELLRMVPGLNVARIDSSHWAISARGGNGRFANKLLVLMDGRTVYTPLFSGVYWNVQDTLMEDIERIEVIRGPGATAWGSNAVNGVINIITRSAENTHGLLASVVLGKPETANVGIRYGASTQNTDYRIFAKARKNAHFDDGALGEAHDAWQDNRLGFRLDSVLSVDDKLTMQGDVYRNDSEQTTIYSDLSQGFTTVPENYDDEGANILARWNHNSKNSNQTSLQVYYDYQKREEAHDKRHTFDIDLQYQLKPMEQFGWQHEWVMGLGYNIVNDTIKGSDWGTIVIPEQQSNEIISAFIQDEVTLNDYWHVTIGSKFEHNDYTGLEVQPSIRLLWQPEENHSLWLSVSKASRTPSRMERTGFGSYSSAIPAQAPIRPVPIVLTGRGNKDQSSEKLLAYEMGYRVHFKEQLSLDFAAFYNEYSDLRTIELAELDASHLPFYLEQFSQFDNLADAKTWGFEFSGDWRFSEKWRMQLAYSFLEMAYEAKKNSTDPSIEAPEKQNPKHQLSLRLSYDPSFNWETDLWIRYVDKLNVSGEDIPRYWTADARIGWSINKNLTLSLVGQNLFKSSHLEYNEELNRISNTEVPRGIFVKAVWNY